MTDATTQKKHYRIKDLKTGFFVGGVYVSIKRARSRADTLDNAYGAYRYVVVCVEA